MLPSRSSKRLVTVFPERPSRRVYASTRPSTCRWSNPCSRVPIQMAPLRSVSKVVMVGSAPERGKETGKGSAAAPATCQIRPSFAASTTPSAVSVQADAPPCPSKTSARSGCHRHAPFDADTHSRRRLSSKTGPTLSPNWPLSPTHSVVVPWTAHNRPGGSTRARPNLALAILGQLGDQLTGRALVRHEPLAVPVDQSRVRANPDRAIARSQQGVNGAAHERLAARRLPWNGAHAIEAHQSVSESQATSSRPRSGRWR